MKDCPECLCSLSVFTSVVVLLLANQGRGEGNHPGITGLAPSSMYPLSLCLSVVVAHTPFFSIGNSTADVVSGIILG